MAGRISFELLGPINEKIDVDVSRILIRNNFLTLVMLVDEYIQKIFTSFINGEKTKDVLSEYKENAEEDVKKIKEFYRDTLNFRDRELEKIEENFIYFYYYLLEGEFLEIEDSEEDEKKIVFFSDNNKFSIEAEEIIKDKNTFSFFIIYEGNDYTPFIKFLLQSMLDPFFTRKLNYPVNVRIISMIGKAEIEGEVLLSLINHHSTIIQQLLSQIQVPLKKIQRKKM